MSPRRDVKQRILCVIVTYNPGDLIRKVVESVLPQVNALLIVDNGSDVETTGAIGRILRDHPGQVTAWFKQENVGLASALNAGVTHALENDYGWVLILDHDSVATPGMVDGLLCTYEELLDRRPGIVSPQHVDAETGFRYRYPKFGRFLFSYGTTDGGPLECSNVMTSGNLIPKEVFENVGLFREEYFIYAVDNNFCKRVLRGGYRIFVSDRAALFHREGTLKLVRFLGLTLSTPDWKERNLYYVFRNVVYDFRVCPRFSSTLHNALFLAKIFLLLFLTDRRTLLPRLQAVFAGVTDGLMGKMGKNSRCGGSRDGIKDRPGKSPEH